LPIEQRQNLTVFSRKRAAELHGAILEDDGVARLVEKWREIRVNVEQMPGMKSLQQETSVLP
jgi:hypothetical protein